MIAARIANLTEGRPPETLSIDRVSQADAAELLNVGVASVARAAKVQANGAPELVQAVENGKASVSAAATVAALPAEEQREIVARGEGEILAAAKEIRLRRHI